eukprot:TRINITY_DN6271_c0_g1_i4.p1 TRINITY_DN6271_c0_g1~~TRINITY_DN6271_c0_g1_i4.p1  ORF type:complete len:580 (+),score=102.62 TRINITY_DN6271_c0_g1_i4:1425-3164(+)
MAPGGLQIFNVRQSSRVWFEEKGTNQTSGCTHGAPYPVASSSPRHGTAGAAGVLISAALLIHGAFAARVTVNTSLGALSGTALSDGVQQFLGIPYAAPPTGALRFRPAAPAVPWRGELDATGYGAPCVQPDVWFVPFSSNQTREDCLTLNIWSPPGAIPSSNLPCLVWIHGGGNTVGAGSLPEYNGSHFAQAGVVTVTINYRLAAFGQLATLEQSREEPGLNSTGGMNFLSDQLQALQWVQAHVQRFGGSGSKVTVFGESAGGLSVCALLASPGARGLFRSAVIQSGACNGPWGPDTTTNGISNGHEFLQSLNVSSVKQLRLLSTQQILASSMFASVGISIDGAFLEDHPSVVFSNGNFSLASGSSVLLGSNTLDGTLEYPWTDEATLPRTAAEYSSTLTAYFGQSAQRVLGLYPPHPNLTRAYLEINSDLCVVCPTRELAQLLGSAHRPSFLYRYGYNPRDSGLAPHAAEVGMLFGWKEYTCYSHQDCPEPMFAYNSTVSAGLREKWVQLADSGVGPGWAQSNASGGGSAYLDVDAAGELRVLQGYQDVKCEMWEAVELQMRADFCFQTQVSTRIGEQ